jgi:hypothetical protein
MDENWALGEYFVRRGSAWNCLRIVCKISPATGMLLKLPLLTRCLPLAVTDIIRCTLEYINCFMARRPSSKYRGASGKFQAILHRRLSVYMLGEHPRCSKLCILVRIITSSHLQSQFIRPTKQFLTRLGPCI